MESNGLSSLNDAFNVKPQTLTDELESQPDSLDFQPSVQDTIFDSMPTDEQVLPQKSPISTEIPQRIDLSGRNTSYSSTGLYAPVVDSDSSLTAALFRDTTTIGALMNNRSSRDIKSSAELGDFNFINYLKDDMVPYADAFAFDSSEEEMMETEAQVRQELADDALIAANPGKSILYSIPLQLTDPANLLPGGAIYKGFKSASIVTRAATGAAISGIASSSIQETLQQNAQFTRSAQESVFNVLSAGILSGALGAAGAGIGKYRFSKEQHQKAQTEINNVMMGERPSVGAMGVVENEELANIPDKIKGGLKFTARNRLQVSEFTAAQKFAHDIYETNLFQTKNEQGIASSIAVETESKQFKSDYSKAINKMQKVYFESVGVKGNTFKQTRASLKKPEMSFEQYDQAVSYVVTSDTPSGNPTVDAGAKIMQDLYASWAKDLVAAGKLEPDAKPANAAAWFAQVYNQQLIIEQGGARARGPGTFPQALFDDFKKTQRDILNLQESSTYKSIDAEIKSLNLQLKKTKLSKEKTAIKKQISELEAKKLEIAPKKLKTSDGTKLRAIVDDDMLWNQVDNAVDNILSQADGTLLNPALSLLRSLNPSSLKERLILADQLSMRPWHKTSISGVTDMVGRALAPFLAFDKAAKAKGFKDVADWRQTVEAQLKNEYHAKMVGKTGKEAAEITKKFEEVLNDMNASIELIDGIYGQGMNVMTSQPAKYVNYWLTWNLLRLLGGIAISSIPDIGNQIMRNGAYQSIHNGIVPMLNKITAGQSKQDLQAMGHIMETALGVRIKSFADNQSLTTFPNPFERAVDSMAQNFGNLTFINQWNDLQQFWAGTVSINRTLNTIAKIVEGKKVAQKDRTRLAHLGIKERDFGYIYEQTKNNIAPNGTRLSDWTNWKVDNAEQVQAQRDFVNATGKDIRSIVIEPGLGDKPLFAHTNAGKAILQFKSFAFAATNKILISGYQRKRDAEVWQGLVSLLTFGAASYVINTKLRGQEVDYSFANMAHEAIDRSGVIGILTDVVNIAQKSNLFPGENVSRYHTRNIEGALLGPTVGAISEIFGAISAAAGTAKDKELTARDIQAFVRLLPFQNLFYLQGLNRVFVGKIAETFDLEDNR